MESRKLVILVINSVPPLVIGAADALALAGFDLNQALRKSIFENADSQKRPGLLDQIQPFDMLGGAHGERMKDEG